MSRRRVGTYLFKKVVFFSEEFNDFAVKKQNKIALKYNFKNHIEKIRVQLNWQSSGLQNRWLGVRVSPPVHKGKINDIVMQKLRAYISDSYNELMNKVSWPTWAELQSSSIVVLVATLLFGIVVFLIDSIFQGSLNQIGRAHV